MKAHSNTQKNKKGFVVLYTVLISSIILAITIGISSISLGEVILSGTAKEGNISFFAADAGAECALYFDRIEGLFDSLPQLSSFTCNQAVSSTLFASADRVEFEFNTNVDETNNCARVSIEKGVSIDGASSTRILSRGYNISCTNLADPNFNDSRTIERAIRVTFTE